MIFTIYLISCVISAILSYGLFFANFQGRYPSIAKDMQEEDCAGSIMLALIIGMLSLVGLGLAFLMTGFGKHGLKFTWSK